VKNGNITEYFIIYEKDSGYDDNLSERT